MIRSTVTGHSIAVLPPQVSHVLCIPAREAVWTMRLTAGASSVHTTECNADSAAWCPTSMTRPCAAAAHGCRDDGLGAGPVTC